METGLAVSKTLVAKCKQNTLEIVVKAVIDITENVALYALPVYEMSKLKSTLQSVVEMVEDSDYGDQDSNIKIFDSRQDKYDFKEFFQRTCTSGIRVLGKEVSFVWTLMFTFFGSIIAGFEITNGEPTMPGQSEGLTGQILQWSDALSNFMHTLTRWTS